MATTNYDWNHSKAHLPKGMCGVFVCMAVKAVHLQLVTELTTETFLATLCHFFSWRWLPSDIFSDHGTNFVSASQELAELHQFLDKSEVQRLQAISWWGGHSAPSLTGTRYHSLEEK